MTGLTNPRIIFVLFGRLLDSFNQSSRDSLLQTFSNRPEVDRDFISRLTDGPLRTCWNSLEEICLSIRFKRSGTNHMWHATSLPLRRYFSLFTPPWHATLVPGKWLKNNRKSSISDRPPKVRFSLFFLPFLTGDSL